MIKVILVTVSYGAIVPVIVLGAQAMLKVSQASQYCMVSSFFIGFFGSIFISNPLRILLITMVLPYAANNKCLKWFVSKENMRIFKDIKTVQAAQNRLETVEEE
jgi:hypothetical protein